MPVTAKLSQQFCERLGNDVANELVDWLNAVDTSYRQEFRDLFEANFGRVRAELEAMRSEFRGRMEGLEARLDAKLDRFDARLTRRMFYFWVGTVGTILAMTGTILALTRR